MTLERLRPLDLDGLVLYDIDDESDRNPAERPFPFLPTWTRRTTSQPPRGPGRPRPWSTGRPGSTPAEPAGVARGPGSRPGDVGVRRGVVAGQGVGRRSREAQELRREVGPTCRWAASRSPSATPAAATSTCACSPSRTPAVVLRHPGRLRRQRSEGPGLGLPLRVPRARRDAGADRVHLLGLRLDEDPGVPRWLGVDVPRWIQNDLVHAADPLEASFEQALAAAAELIAYCRRVGVPFGLNVESVSIRRVEIERRCDSPRSYERTCVESC